MKDTSYAAADLPAPQIVAHRGAGREAPENTQAAFDAAVALGAAGIEFDVQLTRDGHPVVYHDRTLSRIGIGRRYVSDFTLRELRAFDWGGWFDRNFQGEPLPTLESVLRRFANRTSLFIEVKSRERDRRAGRHRALTGLVIASIRKLIPERGRKRISILSFDREVLEAAALDEPCWNYVFNVEETAGFTMQNRPRGVQLSACCIPVKRLTPVFAARVRREGLRLMTYACNTPRQVRAALSAKADLIMSDDPRWILGFLSRKASP